MCDSELSLNEKLVEEVKKYPFLFNKKEREYKNSVKKFRAWDAIAKKLNLAEAEDCSKKWKSLRDRYTRELKKRNTVLHQSGTESQQLEMQTWDLFDSLSFLRVHCEPNKNTVTNYNSLTSSCSMQVPGDRSSSSIDSNNEEIIYLETVELNSPGSSDSCYSRSETSTSTKNTSTRSHEQVITPNRRVQKRKTLEDVNLQFIEAVTIFKEMCSGLDQKKNQPTEDELFGQRVVAFIGAINNEEDKNNAKAGVLKYLAECVSAQFE